MDVMQHALAVVQVVDKHAKVAVMISAVRPVLFSAR